MRTWLFAPGHESRKLQKALHCPVDVVIVDWEDAVPAERKLEAREHTRAILTGSTFSPRVVLRVNSPKYEWFADDILALADLPLGAVMLPKVEAVSEVMQLVGTGLPLIPLIESAIGIERIFEIATAHSLVERLGLGSLDLLADLGAQWTPAGEALFYARSRLVIASRAAGLEGAIDGVYPRLHDSAGLRQDTEIARTLGFMGKQLLHPEQISLVQETFFPTAEEIKQAREIVEAFQEAAALGRATLQIEGRFIDPPVVKRAYQILRLVEAKQDQGV